MQLGSSLFCTSQPVCAKLSQTGGQLRTSTCQPTSSNSRFQKLRNPSGFDPGCIWVCFWIVSRFTGCCLARFRSDTHLHPVQLRRSTWVSSFHSVWSLDCPEATWSAWGVCTYCTCIPQAAWKTRMCAKQSCAQPTCAHRPKRDPIAPQGTPLQS